MFISVKAISSASINQVIQKSKGEFVVKVVTAAQKQKANKKVVQLLADYFKVSKSDVMIVKGKYHSKKIISIRKELKKEIGHERRG